MDYISFSGQNIWPNPTNNNSRWNNNNLEMDIFDSIYSYIPNVNTIILVMPLTANSNPFAYFLNFIELNHIKNIENKAI